MKTPTAGEVDKSYLELDSGDPSLELPVKVGLGPYGYQWCNIDGDDWLYIGGYIGMTRFQYSSGGTPLERFAMDPFDTRLSTVHLDGANAIAGGAIKRYRYLQHGIDDLMFVTGTHTAARGGTAFSGGLMSFHTTQLDKRWKLSYMSRCYNTVRLRNRVVREADGSLLQEFCHTGWFNSDYVHTIPAGHVPANRDPKVFCYDHPSGGTMRDRMGFGVAGLDGSFSLVDIAYSDDRRYLLILQQGGRFLTFDPQSERYVDGRQLSFGSEISIAERNRPSHSLLRSPDDRLFIYAAPAADAASATFIEIKVSAAGEISFLPHIEVQFPSAEDREETFDSALAYLPDYANGDGSYDLFLGQNYSNPNTDCRLIEDFIPPRRFDLGRTLNVVSAGAGGVSVTGTKPGATPYSATCADAESIALTANSAHGYLFQEWQGEDGSPLGGGDALQLAMDADRSVTAVYALAPPTDYLVVSEIQFDPAPPTAAEISAGFTDRDAFEFIELLNAGVTDLDLAGVNFVQTGDAGIAFDFSSGPIQTLAPGERVLAVADLAAFTERHGAAIAARVTGEYTGNLGDRGDSLTLRDSTETLRAFTFSDAAPWPEAPAAGGFSLVLIDPGGHPTPGPQRPVQLAPQPRHRWEPRGGQGRELLDLAGRPRHPDRCPTRRRSRSASAAPRVSTVHGPELRRSRRRADRDHRTALGRRLDRRLPRPPRAAPGRRRRCRDRSGAFRELERLGWGRGGLPAPRTRRRCTSRVSGLPLGLANRQLRRPVLASEGAPALAPPHLERAKVGRGIPDPPHRRSRDAAGRDAPPYLRLLACASAC